MAMGNTNFQTIYPMGGIVNGMVKQATGREPVDNLDMDYVTVAQNTVVGELEFTGDVVQFQTGRSVPIRKLEVSLEPVQSGSGDPSPDNVRPISGWDAVKVYKVGKNLLPPQVISNTWSDITVSTDEHGAITINGTATAYRQAVATGTIKLPEGTYTLSANGTNVTGANLQLRSPDGLTTYAVCGLGGSAEFTLTATTELKLRVTVGNGTSVDQTFNPFIEVGSATDYEPYTGETITTEFPTPPGTVYGGTLDVVSGKLTVTRRVSTTAELKGWNWNLGTLSGYPFVRIQRNAIKTTGKTDVVCSHFPYSGTSTNIRPDEVKNQVGNYYNLTICSPDNFTTVQEFKDFLDAQESAGTPFQLLLYLGTPQEYQLTPEEVNTLVGDNTVYSDAGTVDVMYWVYKEMF